MKQRRLRIRKAVAVVLVWAMVLSINNYAWGDEVYTDPDTIELDNNTDGSSECIEYSENEEGNAWLSEDDDGRFPSGSEISGNQLSYNCYPEQIRTLSENWDSLSSNLSQKSYVSLKGDTYSFLIEYPTAIWYRGGKIKYDKKYNYFDYPNEIILYYTDEKTISDADIDIIKASGNSISQLDELGIKGAGAGYLKVSIKGSKGATVDITGRGNVPANKCTYIKGLKVTKAADKKTKNKVNKELKKALKSSGYVDKIKKEKQVVLSANGCREGGVFGEEKDMYPLAIGVYPAPVFYIPYACKALFDSTSSNTVSGGYIYEKYGPSVINHCNLGEENKYGLNCYYKNDNGEVNYVEFLYADWVEAAYCFDINTDCKIKNKRIKSVKVMDEVHQKKATLKQSTSMKAKGLVSGDDEYIIVKKTNSKKDDSIEETKYLRADTNGNFFGTLYVKTKD